jgi:hypothetical protein
MKCSTSMFRNAETFVLFRLPSTTFESSSIF